MRLSIRTDLAMRALMYCAANPDVIVRRHDVALACSGSENHLAQVIHQLGRAGFLRTVRGRAGGLMLARSPAQIRVGQVFRSFEAPLSFADCLKATDDGCALSSACRMKCVLERALAAFYASLDQVTLADLMTGNTEMRRILMAAD